jgi:Uma2 family endonuclease
MAVEPQRRRFNVAEYYQMAAAGILHEDDRVELIDGEIIQMSPIGAPHASCVLRSNNRLGRAVGEAAIVSVQNPLRLGDFEEPVPDLMLLRPRADFYGTQHPSAMDVLLLIEVSDTTMAYDQRVKLPRYAQFGVPEVWIVDLNRDLILVHREPKSDGYLVVETYRRGSHLTIALLPGLDVAVDDILG